MTEEERRQGMKAPPRDACGTPTLAETRALALVGTPNLKQHLNQLVRDKLLT
jgi:hypothetical protein